jgi:large conductance mechanosensitive channel
MKIVQEFKKFISRGNILDLSVAVIIGAAFGKIVNSFVKDIITPIISLVIGSEGFANYKYVIQEANPDLNIAENAIYYGSFIQNIIDFLIIAVVIFFLIKLINKTKEISKDVINETKKITEKSAEKTNDLLSDIKILLNESINKNQS